MRAFVANPGKRAKKKAARRRHNPLPLLVGNPHRRSVVMAKKSHHSKNKSHGRHAGRNPLGRPRHHRNRHHRRNPFMGESYTDLAKYGVSGAVGVLADAYLPAWLLGLLGKPDTGIIASLVALGFVLLPSYVFERAGMKKAALGYFTGAMGAFVWRIVDQVTGQQYVQVKTGMGSFLVPVSQAQAPLPGPNIFPAGARRMLPAAAPAQTGSTGAASGASTMAVSKSPSAGVSYFVA
jgi:hypothetical protein